MAIETTAETSEQPESEGGTRRKRDPELRAIENIVAVFEDIPAGAQGRAMAYLQSRFGQFDGVDLEHQG